MKSNFKFGKLLGCILFAFVMALGNILFVFNGFSDESNKTYAAVCYQGSACIAPIRLNSDVSLTGIIYYTAYCSYDGHPAFYSIDKTDTWLIGNTEKYEWFPGNHNYTLSDDGCSANIRLNGQLKEEGFFWNTIDNIAKDYSIWL